MCMDCMEACKGEALEVSGKLMAIDDVVEEACKDEIFYINSGGGVTLSGGEPLSQPAFAYQFLKKCKERSINTALDTSGYAPWESIRSSLKYTDLVLFDIKHLDPDSHHKGTGVENDLIIENLERIIASNNTRVWIRVPVIPGYSDSDAYFKDLSFFLKDFNVEKVSLLKYHEWGKSKYEALGRGFSPIGEEGLTETRLEVLKGIMESEGLYVTIDY